MADPGLLERALTHRSAGPRHYERLEFLGDALLNAVVAEWLYGRYPNADEGRLSRLRASVVNQAALAAAARRLRLGDALLLGPGELKSGGCRRESILADAFEALVAAIYLDAGIVDWRERVLGWLAPELEALASGAVPFKDPKTRLQEWLQARHQALPQYRLLRALGEDHEREFFVECALPDLGLVEQAQGSSRRSAEQRAAEALLARLERAR